MAAHALAWPNLGPLVALQCETRFAYLLLLQLLYQVQQGVLLEF